MPPRPDYPRPRSVRHKARPVECGGVARIGAILYRSRSSTFGANFGRLLPVRLRTDVFTRPAKTMWPCKFFISFPLSKPHTLTPLTPSTICYKTFMTFCLIIECCVCVLRGTCSVPSEKKMYKKNPFQTVLHRQGTA